MSDVNFAIRLKITRTEKGFTQHTLAKLLNVSFGTVGNWEAGTRKPDSDMLRRIADTLDVSVDYLLGREGYKNSPSSDAELSFALSEKEKTVILAYRAHPDMQNAVDTLLEVHPDSDPGR